MRQRSFPPLTSTFSYASKVECCPLSPLARTQPPSVGGGKNCLWGQPQVGSFCTHTVSKGGVFEVMTVCVVRDGGGQVGRTGEAPAECCLVKEEEEDEWQRRQSNGEEKSIKGTPTKEEGEEELFKPRPSSSDEAVATD